MLKMNYLRDRVQQRLMRRDVPSQLKKHQVGANWFCTLCVQQCAELVRQVLRSAITSEEKRLQVLLTSLKMWMARRHSGKNENTGKGIA
jgi:hypothetical protein